MKQEMRWQPSTVTQQKQEDPAPGQGVIAEERSVINANGATPGQTPGGAPAVATPGEQACVAATYHTGQHQAAIGQVAKDLNNNRATSGEHRTQAEAFFEFLNDPQNDLQDLNGDDSTLFTALVAVSDSHKVKFIYRLGIGTAGIRKISSIAGKLLALFGEGGGVL